MARNLKLTLLIVGTFLGGCVANFEPRLGPADIASSGLPTAREIRAGVEVSVEEFASPGKARKAFDADMAAMEVLAVAVRVENNSPTTYKIRRAQIRAFQGGKSLTSLHGYEAAKQGAQRGYVWNALVNTAAIGPLAIYFWPASVALSATHTRSVNRKIEHHFEGLEFRDVSLGPGDKAAGFIFFKLPERKKVLEHLTIEVALQADGRGKDDGRPLIYKLALPPVELASD